MYRNNSNIRTTWGKTLPILIAYIFCNFILNKTVFESPILVYGFLFVVFGMVVLSSMQSGQIILLKEQAIWLPFVLYTIFEYVITGDFLKVIYWIIALLVILSASKNNTINNYPYKMIYVFGIIAAIGVYVQLLFPTFYNSNIATLFQNSNNIILWANRNYGLAGFTYQLGTTAIILVHGIAVLICIQKDNVSSKTRYIIGLLFLYIALFLTQKRMALLEALLIPLILVFIQKKNASKKIKVFFGVLIVAIIGYYLFVNYFDYFFETKAFHRLTDTFILIRDNQDFSSGRDLLYLRAIELFKQKPFLGIGTGMFSELSGAETEVHNAYIQIMCEQGILGLGLYVIPLIVTLIRTVKIYKSDENNNIIKYALFVQLIYIFNTFSSNPNIGLSGYMMYFISLAMIKEYQISERQI